jgi:6,7-dimethyl-8-ribityllumazine synthase
VTARSAGAPRARARRFCLVAARFNQVHVERMLGAALDVLRRNGVADGDLVVRRVPGSFELPLACRRAAESGEFVAVIALGVLIRGETEHFRLIADATTHGLMRAMLDTGVPVLHGVLAVHDAAQAEARTGGERGNRGAEVALAALSLLEDGAREGGR